MHYYFVISVAAISGHLLYDIIDAEFKEYYTKQMKYGDGIAATLSLIIMFYELVTANLNNITSSLRGSVSQRSNPFLITFIDCFVATKVAPRNDTSLLRVNSNQVSYINDEHNLF